MQMNATSFDAKAAPMVDVLTDNTGTNTIGYRLGGFRAGPSLLVAGHAPVADRVYARLIALPSIGWMRGSLTLVILNKLENFGIDAFFSDHFAGHIGQNPDDLHFLPYQLDPSFHAVAADQGYWSTLRLCAALGMIYGRGIPKPAANDGMSPHA